MQRLVFRIMSNNVRLSVLTDGKNCGTISIDKMKVLCSSVRTVFICEGDYTNE